MSTTSKNRKKMARRKSIDDIYRQRARIGELGGAANGSGFWHSSRGRRVNEIANRYERNMANVRGVSFTKNGIGFLDNTRKISRSTYMGLNAG